MENSKMNKIFIALLTILLITSSACIYINPAAKEQENSKPQPGVKQPVAYIDSISPSTAFTGDAVTFTGHGTDADGQIIGYEWRSDIDGTLSTVAGFTTSSLSPGTHTITFRVLDNQSLWSMEKSSTVTIKQKIALPVIESFVAVPGSIVLGGSTELQWNVTGADTVTINNGIGEVVASGSIIQYPQTNISYTLTAANDGGSVIATTSITVTSSPQAGNPVIDFTADYLGGNSWKLTWNVLYATDIKITPDIGTVGPTGSTIVTVPSGTTTYRLNATNDWGWAYWDVTLVSP
jgi:hypothetical protein